MNNKQFLNEVLASESCPKDFKKIYDDFQYYQNKALDTLFEFHKICEKHKIPYVMAYGSLLGLIRDGGQIPWDYDVDVLVPYEKREELIKALNEELPKDFYYNYLNNNKRCRHMLMRLAPVEFRTEALHVDVFFLIGASNNEKDRKKMAKQISLISKIRYYKYVDIGFEGYKRPKRKLKLILKRIQYMLIPIKPLMKKYYSLCEKYSSMTSEYSIRADSAAQIEIFKSKDVWNTMLKKNDSNQELRIPINYEQILINRYGNYKKIPDLNQRIHEVLYHYKSLIRAKRKID